MGTQIRVTLNGYPEFVFTRLRDHMGLKDRDTVNWIINRLVECDGERLAELPYDVSLERFKGAEVFDIAKERLKGRAK